MKQPVVVDIDETLLKCSYKYCDHCGRWQYDDAVPIQEEIDRVNDLFLRGFEIILFTGRGWDLWTKTREQLKDLGINYTSLVMGKVQGPYFDRDAKRSLSEIDC